MHTSMQNFDLKNPFFEKIFLLASTLVCDSLLILAQHIPSYNNTMHRFNVVLMKSNCEVMGLTKLKIILYIPNLTVRFGLDNERAKAFF